MGIDATRCSAPVEEHSTHAAAKGAEARKCQFWRQVTDLRQLRCAFGGLVDLVGARATPLRIRCAVRAVGVARALRQRPGRGKRASRGAAGWRAPLRALAPPRACVRGARRGRRGSPSPALSPPPLGHGHVPRRGVRCAARSKQKRRLALQLLVAAALRWLVHAPASRLPPRSARKRKISRIHGMRMAGAAKAGAHASARRVKSLADSSKRLPPF